ncbi:MAG TPA: hypothetical protein VJ483_09690 [Holophagaceae bacterium]|nr:hypothetical protein [Holophagaceae bacterium]
MRLGTAVWMEGISERRALVAALGGDRVVDLNRVERVRLVKLGEGLPEPMADVLVPSSLRRALEGGPRALQRIRTALAYAEKWARRGNLPEAFAPRLDQVQLLPCLPRPALLRRADGVHLDRLQVLGPGAELPGAPVPTLAVIGLHGGSAAGHCLALESHGVAQLGAWLAVEEVLEGELQFQIGGHSRRAPLEAWRGLELPDLRAGEALLLPPPRMRALPDLPAGLAIQLKAPFETLQAKLGREPLHPTVQ